MAFVRELVTKIGFETDKKSVKKVEGSVDKVKGKLKKGFSALQIGGITAAVYGIGKAFQTVVAAAANMEMLTTQFEVMLGSAEEAETLMGRLKVFAASTPFALDTLAKGTQNLLSFGVAQDEVVETMRMLGDTPAGMLRNLKALSGRMARFRSKAKLAWKN